MSKEYRNINELYEVVMGARLFDLAPHAVGLDPSLQAALKDPPRGLYIRGSVDPLFEEGGDYSILGPVETPVTFDQIDSDCAKKFILPRGNIRNNKSKVVVNRAIYERIKTQLRNEPAVSAAACHAARAVIYSYLNSLCRHTSVYAGRFDLREIVKEEHHHLVEDGKYETAFDNLVLEVERFVGRDTWSIYTCSMKDSTLLIEKGLDFRIIDWHTQQIEGSEGFDHDRGGVVDGYEVQSVRSSRR